MSGNRWNCRRVGTHALLLVGVTVGCLMLSACGRPNPSVDLAELTNFANAMNNASPTIGAIPEDYVDSCNLRLEYTEDTRLGAVGGESQSSDAQRLELTAPPPNLGPVPSIPTSPPASSETPATRAGTPSSITIEPEPLITPGPSCASVERVAEEWRDVNTAVLYYLKALGDIAGVDTAPDVNKYNSLADKLSANGLLPKSTGAVAAKFVAGIGHRIIRGQQERAIQDLLALSQEDDVLNQLLAIGEANSGEAHAMLVGTKSVIDSLYIHLITSEVKYLRAMLPRSRRNLELQQRLKNLRLTILHQRSDWYATDSGLRTQDLRLNAYSRTMYDIGRINGSIVHPTVGIAGLSDAVRPWIDDLGSQARQLVRPLTPEPVGRRF